MIDPKKLLALVQRENGVKPMAAPPMEGDELIEDELAEPEEGEAGGEGEGEAEGASAISEEELEEIVEMIEAGEGDPMLMQLAAELAAEIDEFGEEAEQPPAWAVDPAIWDEAEKAVDPEGKGSKYTEPYAVVAHVYQRLGGTVA